MLSLNAFVECFRWMLSLNAFVEYFAHLYSVYKRMHIRKHPLTLVNSWQPFATAGNPLENRVNRRQPLATAVNRR